MTAVATTTPPTLRTPALVGGLGLLAMAVIAGVANFGAIEALVTLDDPAATARDILASETTFRLGIVGLLVVAVLDVIVAWALWTFFAPVHAGVSAVAAGFRVVYAAVFMVGIVQLSAALEVLRSAGTTTVFTTEQLQFAAMDRIGLFHLVWDAGLLLFGLHLALLGYLVHRAGRAPRLLGWLLAVAGLGYVLDSVGALVAPGAVPEVAEFTFVGEVVLLVWLLTRGRTATAEDLQPTR